FMGARVPWFMRVVLVLGALLLIEGGWVSDLIGIGVAAATVFVQRVVKPEKGALLATRGAD
ncbi:MAG: hypothetical protein AAGI92_11955, partial [Pseudomonadota bacterium]